MKTIYKNISLSAVLVIFLSVILSCSDLLESEPTTGVSNERSIYDKKSAITALNGTYYLLGASGYYGLNYNIIPFLFADNVKFVGIQTYYKIFIRPNGYGKTNLQSDNSALSSVWSAIYETINSANHLIDKVNNINDEKFTQAERNDILGQAYFIRALSYFDLSRYWGGVQLILKPTTQPNDIKGIKRSTLEQTYEQINADLLKAEELLSATSSRIYADLGAVQALIARLSLYKKDWSRAESYASLLISNSKYKLVEPYAGFYTNKATTESIFELEYTTSRTNPSDIWWLPAELGGRYEVSLSEVLVSLLQDSNTGGNRSEIIKVSEKSKQIYNGMYWRAEYDDPEYLFRISEQYLIRAEARAHLNNFTGSLEDLNRVRIRADVPALSSGEYNTLEKALQVIENERRVEFAVENHRYFDLLRTGRLNAVLGETEGYLFPIPIEELNKDSDLEPNPSN
jgi:hypothetical protein